MIEVVKRMGWMVAVLTCMTLIACGGGSGDAAEEAPDPDGGNSGPDQVLRISGSPTSAMVGRPYRFALTVQGLEQGAQTTFDHNLPKWADLDASDPERPAIAGTPATGDIGSTDVTVTITVGDRQAVQPASVSFTLTVVAAILGDSRFVGVPDPSGLVPAAIMPALPSDGGMIQAFPYDPIEMETPEWQNGSNQYWVDANGACDDSDNSGRGAPDTPRCTLPGINGMTWTLAAGSQVFVVGNGASYGGEGDINQINFPGTADQPIWIIGVGDASTPRWVNQPKFAFQRFFVGDSGTCTHLVMENIHFYSVTDDFRGGFSTADDGDAIEYLTFREMTCSGSGTFDPYGTESSNSRRCFSFNGARQNPVRFVVIYDTDMFGLGRWYDDYDTSVDLIGMHVQGATRYVWFLNNRAYHLQGDSIHCSNSNQWDFEKDRRPHYIYVAGSEFYENYENAWDSKGCYHVVFSENLVHDFTNSVKSANNTAVIAANDAESYVGAKYEWYINNRFENVGNAFAYKGTQEDAYVYFIGNLVSNTLTGAAIQVDARCKTHDGITTCGDGMYVAQNTFDCNAQGPAVVATRSGTTTDGSVTDQEQNQEMTFIGNIFYDCTDAANADGGASPHGWESINANFLLTYHFNVDFRDPSMGAIGLSAFNDSEIGNLTNVNPLFANPTSRLDGDYALQLTTPDLTANPVRALVTEASAYDLFYQLYGLDIRMDLRGNTWSAGAALNAGALQE